MNDKELEFWMEQQLVHAANRRAGAAVHEPSRQAAHAKFAVKRLIKERDEARRVARVLGQFVRDYSTHALTSYEAAARDVALTYPEIET